MVADVGFSEWKLAELHDDYIFEGNADGLSEPEKVYLVLWRFSMECYNGGILQFFENSSGVLTPHVCGALTSVGATHLVPVVEAAIKLYDTDFPSADHLKRHAAAVAMSQETRDRIGDIDHQINPHLENLSVVLFQYVFRHRDQFDRPDDFWQEPNK